ncbi:MAG TPA: 6,7-dimethyl-8-ribityllumazine synthase [Polyangia bacterium]|nr:6,7-dimethyl-8-ribityllumazine synthase [Polyangia bacterium]
MKVAIVAARFNAFIVDPLLAATTAKLRDNGVGERDIFVAHVPGAFEVPAVAQRLAEGGGWDAIICLGCVIRGATSHYELVAGHAAYGVGEVAMKAKVPVIFGVLTVENVEQAIERVGHGASFAQSALDMATLYKQMEAQR